MLIEFKFKNFLSFKDLTTFSLVSYKSFNEHSNTNLIKVDSSLNLLKSSVIYGSNGSGKSNFIKSISYFKTFIKNSFRDALIDTNMNNILTNRFQLSTVSETEPSFFEVSFFHKKKKYRYGFEVTNQVVSEWLYQSKYKETLLFHRKSQEFKINKSALPEANDLTSKTKSNVLFLTLMAQFNGKISNTVMEWVDKVGVINGIDDIFYSRYTIDRLKGDSNFRNWVTKFVKFLDIEKLSTTEKDKDDLETLKSEVTDKEFQTVIKTIQNYVGKQPKENQIITWHKKYNEDNIVIDVVPFDFENQESEGTKKLIYLLGPWYDSLKNGKILFIDELDSRLHTNLTIKLIEFFHQANSNNAQLIFVAHDAHLLNNDYFRRDQIWFTEKNQFEVSDLYSLADFKSVRKKSAFEKNYLKGKYGAVPNLEYDSNELVESIVEGEEKQQIIDFTI